MDQIRGRLSGMIESFGLPERQERSAVATLKALANDLEAKLLKDIKNISNSA